MLPLRAFLGGTFVYAGLQKLADPNFLRSGSPASIQSQLAAATSSSPIGSLLEPLRHVAVLVGLVIALVELAVGIATLLGLWSRVTAACGLLLSFGFLLAVSWHSRPYYFGPDIVFCFAWTPAVLAPPGPWTVDRWLGTRARFEQQRFETGLVGIAFGTVQQVCGHYGEGRCTARDGRVCEPAPCPVLNSHRIGARQAIEDVDRRELLARARLAGLVALPIALTGGAAAVIGRVLSHPGSPTAVPTLGAPSAVPSTGRRPATSTSPSSRTPASGAPQSTTPAVTGRAIGAASAVPVGGVARFADPTSGQPAVVVQPQAGQFKAFSAVCTHQGCTVGYPGSGNELTCPCHGARFDLVTGAVLQGPARDPLPAIAVAVRSGQLYVHG